MSEMIGAKKNDARGLAPGFETNPYEKLDDMLFNPDLEYIVSVEDDYLKIALAQFLNDNNLQQKTKDYKNFEYMFISFDLGTFNFIEKPTLGDKRLYEMPYDWDELMTSLRDYLEENPFEKKEEPVHNQESWSQPMNSGSNAGAPTENDGKSFLERAKAAVTGAKIEANDDRNLYEILKTFSEKNCEITVDHAGASQTIQTELIINDVSPSEVIMVFDDVKIDVDKMEFTSENDFRFNISKPGIETDISVILLKQDEKCDEGELTEEYTNLLNGVKEDTDENNDYKFIFTLGDGPDGRVVYVATKSDFNAKYEASQGLPQSLTDDLESIGTCELQGGVYEITDEKKLIDLINSTKEYLLHVTNVEKTLR